MIAGVWHPKEKNMYVHELAGFIIVAVFRTVHVGCLRPMKVIIFSTSWYLCYRVGRFFKQPRGTM